MDNKNLSEALRLRDASSSAQRTAFHGVGRVKMPLDNPEAQRLPRPRLGHAGSPRDAEGHGGPGGRLQPDRHDHLHAGRPAARRWTPRRSRSRQRHLLTPTGFTLPTPAAPAPAPTSGTPPTAATPTTAPPATRRSDRAGDGQPASPDAQHHPHPDHGHARHDPRDPDRHGHAGERLQPDRDDHLHADGPDGPRSSTPRRSRSTATASTRRRPASRCRRRRHG